MKKQIVFNVLVVFMIACATGQVRQAKEKQSKEKISLPTAAKPNYKNPSLPIENRVEDLISRMTLEEKVSQMVHNSPAIERLDIPVYNWWNECLHGVAFAGLATVFPQSIGLAASWDKDLVFQVANATSDEARAKHHDAVRRGERNSKGLTFWSPNINIFRDPRWGRGQETYGEDPYLTSRLGVAFVKGLQGDDPHYLKVVSTPKHFAVHSGPDPLRHRFDAIADERDLWDTYLPAFEACVREAKAFSVMGAYNRYNGVPCCANELLLEEILRKKWGFSGYVVSDCDAINNIYHDHHFVETPEEASAVAVKAGCDLNCGETYKTMVKAVKLGLISEDTINTSVKRLLEARFRLGMFDPPEMVPYSKIPFEVVDCLTHRKLALKAARESIVLLKNENNMLPLKKDLNCVAVIGPNADSVNVLLGNYCGTPSRAVTPLEGIIRKVSSQTKVLYAKGCDVSRICPLTTIPSSALKPPEDEKGLSGLKGEYFNNINLEGEPVTSRIDPEINFDWQEASPAPEVNAEQFSVRWSGKLIPPISGQYLIGLSTDDGVRLFIDGKNLIDDWRDHGVQTTSTTLTLEANHPYNIVVEFYDNTKFAVARLQWSTPVSNPFDEAISAVKQSDVAIVVLGLSLEIEDEGRDKKDIALPQPQEDLLNEIYNVGKPIILVLINGSPLAINWADEHLPAIVEAWYPGEEGGTAIADVLFGDYNPGGRLPVTFYKSLEQLPPFTDYNMASGRTYRYFKDEPLYPFGYGLSYTSFEYSDLALTPLQSKPEPTVSVSAKIKNTGKLSGDEVVQLYISHKSNSYIMPLHSLEGFERIHLNPDEEKTITITLTPRSFSLVTDKGKRIVEPGSYQITIGGGQPLPDSFDKHKKAQVLHTFFEVVEGTENID